MFVINQDISVIVCNAKSRESFMRLLAILVCACIYGLSAQAHSGGLNSSGCHAGSKPYHCHRAASDMMQGSSGGYRLKCSKGSRSEDCVAPEQNKSNTKSQLPSKNFEVKQGDNSETELIPVNSASSDVKMFGVSFELNMDEMQTILAERFNCNFMKLNSDSWECRTPEYGVPIKITVDELNRPSDLQYVCETFDGCGYSQKAIYQYASGKFGLPGEIKQGSLGSALCGTANSGEKVCVFPNRTIFISRHKYGSEGLNFD